MKRRMAGGIGKDAKKRKGWLEGKGVKRRNGGCGKDEKKRKELLDREECLEEEEWRL